MVYKDWPKLIPRFGSINEIKFGWKLGSSFVVPSVAFVSKILSNCFNKTKIYNHKVFLDAVDNNYKKRENALITISNHSSCLDDPFLWGALFPWKWNFNAFRHRWSAAAHEICFTNPFYSLFFSLGKSVPIHRGKGIYQPSVNFLMQLILDKQFIHIFPQGKVCEELDDLEFEKIKDPQDNFIKQLSIKDKGDKLKEYALKWGLARLILDSLCNNKCKLIEILPFYHVGMEKVLPNGTFIPKVNKSVTIFIRENGVIKFTNELVKDLCKGISSPREKRIIIMNFLENEMKLLKFKALEKNFY